jgi:hypothetical protein
LRERQKERPCSRSARSPSIAWERSRRPHRHAASMHTHTRHVPNLVGAPRKKFILPQNELQTRTRFMKRVVCNARRGEAGWRRRRGCALASCLLSHLGAHLINRSNSLLTSTVRLNFSLQPAPMAATY